MYSVGLDISNLTFTASCVDQAFNLIFYAQEFTQDEDGWLQFTAFLTQHALTSYKIVMENTGVYSERICYFLYALGLNLYVEPPHQIHNAFYDEEKTDPIDSRQIAEYGFRFPDKLHPWQPKAEIVEQVEMLLMTREHLTKMKAACKNTLKSLRKKHRTHADVQQIYEKQVKDYDTQIDALMKNIETVIATNHALRQKVQDVQHFKNVGLLLTCYLLVATEGFTRMNAPALAKYIGVCPLEHTSGTSVLKKKKSRGAGPRLLRKNLYLAAMRMRKDNPEFRTYFERKVAEGKEPRLVINNIENKILRIICGILKSGKPYIPGYRSQKPA